MSLEEPWSTILTIGIPITQHTLWKRVGDAVNQKMDGKSFMEIMEVEELELREYKMCKRKILKGQGNKVCTKQQMSKQPNLQYSGGQKQQMQYAGQKHGVQQGFEEDIQQQQLAVSEPVWQLGNGKEVIGGNLKGNQINPNYGQKQMNQNQMNPNYGQKQMNQNQMNPNYGQKQMNHLNHGQSYAQQSQNGHHHNGQPSQNAYHHRQQSLHGNMNYHHHNLNYQQNGYHHNYRHNYGLGQQPQETQIGKRLKPVLMQGEEGFEDEEVENNFEENFNQLTKIRKKDQE
jgi:hypothetical protein